MTKVGLVVQFGLPPNRIDLLNDIEGVLFDEVWSGKVSEWLDLGDGKKEELFIVGLQQLIKNKEKAGRYKDLEDIKFLKRIVN